MLPELPEPSLGVIKSLSDVHVFKLLSAFDSDKAQIADYLKCS